jgi:cytochrome c oxidase subunit 4
MTATHDETAKAHAHPNYMAIFWWLLGLTIVELIAATIPTGPTYPQGVKGLVLVILAGWKALLVAMYFMHLRFEKRTLALIAATPIVLCVFLLFMLLPDSLLG